MSTLAPPPAPAPYRTPRTVRRALLVLAAIVAVFLVASSTLTLLDLAARKTTEHVTRYPEIGSLVIADASDVHLVRAPAGSALEVRAQVTEGLRSPSRSARRRGDGALVLSSSCPFLFGGSCDVDYEVAVPAGTAVKVDASAGDVQVDDLVSSLPVDLETSAGDITVSGLTAPALRLHSSAGDVDARAVRAPRVSALSSAGDVTLSLRSTPTRLDVESSAGDVDIVVPDSTYRIATRTSAGDINDRDVRNDPASPRVIDARTSAGDITIEPRR